VTNSCFYWGGVTEVVALWLQPPCSSHGDWMATNASQNKATKATQKR